MSIRRGPIAALALIAVALGAATGYWRSGPGSGPPAGQDRPTIVLILTDDQRWDTLPAMPNVQRLLVRHGTTFTNSFVVDPLCCPSRASTLTGRYPHSTGVWDNRGPHGGFHAFDDGSTVPVWLRAVGYHTALFGKYLNGYEGTTYVPPGWERWFAFDGSSESHNLYYDYGINDGGRMRRFGSQPGDYSTDVLAGQAVSYIRRTPGPLFVYFAPYAPHAPAVPAPPDVATFLDAPPVRPPSYDRTGSGQPGWVRRLPALAPGLRSSADTLHRDQLASLQGVDRAVAGIVDALAASGRLDHALIVYTSDNGLSLGEHHWIGKAAPWEEIIRVPLVVRYDPLGSLRRTDPHMVANVDLAPTFAGVAGTHAPGASGASLAPLLSGSPAGWRIELQLESIGGGKGRLPAYCALRTEGLMFVAYASGDVALYDLKADPNELRNRAADPSLADRVRVFEAALRRVCHPPPPGSPPGFPP